jgi:hypothetical protein
MAYFKVTSEHRTLHNEQLHDRYNSPNIIRVIKSRRMRWARHVARIGEMRNAYKVLVSKSEGKNHSKNVGLDGRIILERILGKWVGKVWTRCIWLRTGISGGLL